MDATVISVLLHAPPGVASESEAVAPAQRVLVPAMGLMVPLGATSTIVVANAEPQIPDNV
jgi:hypothetical protein